MGHSLIIKSKGAKKCSFGSFEINAFDRVTAGFFYKSLDAEHLNMGTNGDGEKEYTREDILKAIKKAKYLAGEPVESIQDIAGDNTRNKFLKLFGNKTMKDVDQLKELPHINQLFFQWLKPAIESKSNHFIIEFL